MENNKRILHIAVWNNICKIGWQRETKNIPNKLSHNHVSRQKIQNKKFNKKIKIIITYISDPDVKTGN